MSDDVAETREMDVPRDPPEPQRREVEGFTGPGAELRAVCEALVAQHLALPSHNCRRCGRQFRHQHGGLCWECMEKAYRAKREAAMVPAMERTAGD